MKYVFVGKGYEPTFGTVGRVEYGNESTVVDPTAIFTAAVHQKEYSALCKEFDELMFFTVNGNWSYAMAEYGDTWVILNKSQTNVTSKRLDEFLREKFSQGEYQ